MVTASPSWTLLSLAVFSVLILNGFIEHIWLRRGVFFILFFPVTLFFSLQARDYIKANAQDIVSQRLLLFFNTIFLLILLIPGFYLPPFFDGIAGWALNKKPSGYNITDIRLKFDDGHVEWFRASFYNPITMGGRSFGMVKRRDSGFFYSEEFSCYLYDLYGKAYSSLEKRKLPTQAILGDYSYPPHTFDSFPESANYFPADRIHSFQYVRVSKSESQMNEDVLFEWEINVNTCNK